jgi:AGCS family alanine or glycine:cation symporter
VGNIVGVATALVIGGPGAIFWMWVVAAVGITTSFAESTLAQVYKVRDGDQFRGGPAYYISRGLRWRFFGIAVAALTVLSYMLAFGPIQANAMAAAVTGTFGVAAWVTGLLTAGLAALVILGGIKRIARVAEFVVPFMAIAYVGLAAFVLITQFDQIPAALGSIIAGAFGFQQALGGFVGGSLAIAIQMGVSRGLFSNEAGLGTSPNVAATADVKHPVSQGLTQGFGVFIDTIVISTATALMILLSGVYQPGMDPGTAGSLTSEALTAVIGSAGGVFVTIALLFFAFTSIIAIAYFAETNLAFLGLRGRGITVARLLFIVLLYVGAVRPMAAVWASGDAFLGLVAVANLIAVLALTPILMRVLGDYETQRAAGIDEPVFDPAVIGEIPGLDHDAWHSHVSAGARDDREYVLV